ncbi:MAG: pentapeptide repeat-containing protein [Oscillatoria sp. Prado101]|nr:pentapeptide repeat-containing protein [Oscillatoria sp. Prado101]
MQAPLTSKPQPNCLLMELTGIPARTGAAGSELIDLYLTLHFDEAWQPLMGGRFKFGLTGGQLKLTLENGQMPEQSRQLNGNVQLFDENSTACQVTASGTEVEPCWVFALKPLASPPVLKAEIKNFKLGTLQVTGMPCQVRGVFEVPPACVRLTGVEGLWPHDISPNKHAVLERKLAISIEELQLKPNLSRAVVLQYNSLSVSPHWSSYHTEESAVSSPELEALIQQVLRAKTDDFVELANIAGLNPLSDFAAANLQGTNLNGANLAGANLAGANLRGALLNDADLSEANLSEAKCAGADLSGALLSDANLEGADLHRCALALVSLSGANLKGANFREANLSNANLSDADLTDANLEGADLHHAGLVLTNLTGAILAGALVKEARFKKDSGLSEKMEADLKGRGAIFEEL